MSAAREVLDADAASGNAESRSPEPTGEGVRGGEPDGRSESPCDNFSTVLRGEIEDVIAKLHGLAIDLRRSREFPQVFETDEGSISSWRDGYIRACLDIAERLEWIPATDTAGLS